MRKIETVVRASSREELFPRYSDDIQQPALPGVTLWPRPADHILYRFITSTFQTPPGYQGYLFYLHAQPVCT